MEHMAHTPACNKDAVHTMEGWNLKRRGKVGHVLSEPHGHEPLKHWSMRVAGKKGKMGRRRPSSGSSIAVWVAQAHCRTCAADDGMKITCTLQRGRTAVGKILDNRSPE